MSWLSPEWADRLGWSLIHSLWQTLLIAIAYALVARLLSRSAAHVRYLLGCIALTAMVAAPTVTFLRMSAGESAPKLAAATSTPSPNQLPPVRIGSARAHYPASSSNSSSALQPDAPKERKDDFATERFLVRRLDQWRPGLQFFLPWLVEGWLIGVIMLAARPLLGLRTVKRLRTKGLSPLSTELRVLGSRLAERMRVARAVQFAESALVEVPTVVGYLRPIVLLPASAVTGLSPDEIQLILAHELAHVRRHDYLVNLFQTSIEALLFYHPGMWWVSAQIRRERENCCDDVALTVCGNRGKYIRTLYALEKQRWTPPGLGLAASGGSLAQRVQRLTIGPPTHSGFDPARPWLAGLIVLASVTIILLVGESHGRKISRVSKLAAAAEVELAEPRTNPGDAESSSSIHELDDRGFSKLHRAAMGGKARQIRELVEKGANLDVQQGVFHGTPLQYAASGGHTEAVRTLIELGAAIDSEDANSRTPLIWAAMKGHLEAVRQLLDADAEINAANLGGWTPLHYAISERRDEVAQLLVDRGANVRAENSQGKTPVEVHPDLAPQARTQKTSVSKAERNSGNDSSPKASSIEADSPPELPTDVVATVRGKPVLRSAIEPPAHWHRQRAEFQRQHGHVRGFETPDAYALAELNKLIIRPLRAEFRKEHVASVTEQEIDEFVVHARRAEARRKKEIEAENKELRSQLEEERRKSALVEMAPPLRKTFNEKLSRREAELAALEQAAARPTARDAEQERQFAQWYVGNWKLQQALYREYGGRAIYQQVGPEALDAMETLLRNAEQRGQFAIHDARLREQFWKYYVNDAMHVFIPDPGKIFAHPWALMEE